MGVYPIKAINLAYFFAASSNLQESKNKQAHHRSTAHMDPKWVKREHYLPSLCGTFPWGDDYVLHKSFCTNYSQIADIITSSDHECDQIKCKESV